MRFTEKSDFRGVHEKPKKKRGGGGCLQRKAWAACRFKGGLDKKERGGVFEGGDSYPNVHCNTHHDMT